MRRIALLVLTNIAVLALLTIICKIFGIDTWLAASGYGGLGPLLIVAAIFGFGGAFISLAMSKPIAKWTIGARVIDKPETETERWLLASVRQLADKAGVGMPEVAIYDAPEMNAFATGMSRNHALVAVSTGLLQSMDRDQVSAVLGHEITHVANGDMVTMTLLQGVLNTFVIFLARVVGSVIDSAMSGGSNNRGAGMGYFAIVIVLQIVFGALASLVVMAFSRWREFRADGGGAHLAGRERMISALQRLGLQHGANTLPKAVHAFGISGELARGIQRLWMSHPPIEDRIARLRGIATAAA